jgi:DNA polymerase
MFVCIRLPSGRDLYYFKPSLKMKIPPWEIGKKYPKLRETICYWGQHQQTKQWVEITTHPGKITENIDQAVSRDILMVGMTRADQAGIDVRGHVHDEIIAIANEDEEGAVQTLCDIMTAPMPWAPDLPLAAAGFEGKVYRKD